MLCPRSPTRFRNKKKTKILRKRKTLRPKISNHLSFSFFSYGSYHSINCKSPDSLSKGYYSSDTVWTMALRTMSVLKNAMGSLGCRLSCIRCVHAAPAPLENVMARPIENQFVLPGYDREMENNNRIEVPTFDFGGLMELMAVPKKKISKFRRGIRNGPKALKPIPVIIRCKGCGRVKLPHFFCCSGERGIPGEQN